MAAILVAEDDDSLGLLLTAWLSPSYETALVPDGARALRLLGERPFDLLVADLAMPRLDGLELIHNLRRRGIDIPAIVVTANQSFDAKRSGFSAGADDYLTKPVEREELLWRIRALLRRARIASEGRIELGGLALDRDSYTLSGGGASVELPRKEFELLYKLLSEPGRIYTKNQLMDQVWGYSSESGEETIKTHVSRLRARIKGFEAISLVAVKGIGYKAEFTGGEG